MLKSKNNYYICTKDFQSSDFAVGTIATAKEWGEIAYNWALSDNWTNPEQCLLKNFKNEKDLIYYICDLWEIEVLEIKKENKKAIDFLKDLNNFNKWQISKAKKIIKLLGV